MNEHNYGRNGCVRVRFHMEPQSSEMEMVSSSSSPMVNLLVYMYRNQYKTFMQSFDNDMYNAGMFPPPPPIITGDDETKPAFSDGVKLFLDREVEHPEEARFDMFMTPRSAAVFIATHVDNHKLKSVHLVFAGLPAV